jgi:hypothetical protein
MLTGGMGVELGDAGFFSEFPGAPACTICPAGEGVAPFLLPSCFEPVNLSCFCGLSQARTVALGRLLALCVL